MKKILLSICTVALVAGMANAQDMMSKKGTSIVPEANDWGLGIDANPILHYFGNAFNNGNNAAPSWNFTANPMVISGFMVKDASTAYRVKVRLGIGSNKHTNKVTEDASKSTPKGQVEDELKVSSHNITLGAGIQKMRGKHRVKGIYGAEAWIGLQGSKETYTYGNAFSATNNVPTSTDWTTSPVSTIDWNNASDRPTEIKSGGTFMFGVRGFIGAEYFFAPKISVEGEFGWGPSLTSTGEGEITSESLNATSNGGTSNTFKTGKSSSFNFDTDNNSGSIRLTFYF